MGTEEMEKGSKREGANMWNEREEEKTNERMIEQTQKRKSERAEGRNE